MLGPTPPSTICPGILTWRALHTVGAQDDGKYSFWAAGDGWLAAEQPFLHSQPPDENGSFSWPPCCESSEALNKWLGTMLRCSKLGSPDGLRDPEVKMRKDTPYLEDEVAQPGWHTLFLQAGAEQVSRTFVVGCSYSWVGLGYPDLQICYCLFHIPACALYNPFSQGVSCTNLLQLLLSLKAWETWKMHTVPQSAGSPSPPSHWELLNILRCSERHPWSQHDWISSLPKECRLFLSSQRQVVPHVGNKTSKHKTKLYFLYPWNVGALGLKDADLAYCSHE